MKLKNILKEINHSYTFVLDWNLCDGLDGYLPNPDEDVLTLCNNSGDKFFKVQYYSKNHNYWSDSPFVVAWCNLPDIPNI